MLEHGGRLREAARYWNIPLTDWLDLSTGIAPWAYPVPAIPDEIWQRLPEEDDGLEAVARSYYGTRHLLLLSGSQAGIQTLPRLFPRGRVAIPAPIYNEHPGAWRAAGHELVGWNEDSDYAVVCNPTNPTGQRYSPDELLARARKVRLLVVDEAFLDAESGASMIGCGEDNVVVLRSLGKFFGLAGARVGCAVAAPELLTRLADLLGPWAVANPARWAARHALADRTWQAAQRERSREASHHLAEVLRASGLGESTGTALFQYVATPRAAAIFEALARRGILVRLFAEPAALRFGLPANEDEWQRLGTALKEIS
jgi:cobalamin biosynthetic protein CobC